LRAPACRFSSIFTGVRGRRILRNLFARSWIAAALWCQKGPINPLLGIEVNTASCGVACIFIVVNKVGAFIPVSLVCRASKAYHEAYREVVTPHTRCQLRSVQSPEMRGSRLSARGCRTLPCVGHLTATTVRVGVFVSGVIDSLPFLSASPNKPPWEGEPANPDAGGRPKR
jgi:hypothetical protein